MKIPAFVEHGTTGIRSISKAERAMLMTLDAWSSGRRIQNKTTLEAVLACIQEITDPDVWNEVIR